MDKFISKILLESLDFENVVPFKHKKRKKGAGIYHFNFSFENLQVNVIYQLIKGDNLKHYFPGFPETVLGYNLSFTVNGNVIQGAESTYKTYIKILSTVLRDSIDFIKTIKPDFLLIITSETDELSLKKYKVYSKIIDSFSKEISSEYSIGSYKKDIFNGFLIQKRIKNMTKK